MLLNVSRAYFGPNQFTGGSAAYLLVALEAGDADNLTRMTRQELCRRVAGVLSPSDAAPQCAYPHPASGERPEDPVLALESSLRQVTRAAGQPIGPIAHIPTTAADRIELVMPCTDAEVVRRAGALSIEVVNALLTSDRQQEKEIAHCRARLTELQAFAASRAPSLTEAAILAAAAEIDLPVIRFDRWPFVVDEGDVPPERRGLIQLGHGIHGKRLVGVAPATVHPDTLAQLRDREEKHRVLRESGIPVPERDPEFTNLNSARRAIRSAQRIGYPAVLKPRTSPSGAGVSLNLLTEEAVAAAYVAANAYDHHVVVERYIAGESYRLLVVSGDVVAACRKPPIALSPSPQIPAELDPAALDVKLKTSALRAAGCFGLEVAGVDLVTPDPRLPLAAAGGAVTGVDPTPDLVLHRSGEETIPLGSARRVLTHLFPATIPSRIPIAAITGTVGKTTTCRMVARVLQEAGYSVGLACSDGVYMGRELVNPGVFSGISGALQVFADPRSEMAVLEVSRGTLVQKGLGFSRATVGACIKVEEDHLGLEGIHTVAEMARLKRVVVEHATELAVLNAEDPNCLAMIPHAGARTICLISTDPTQRDLLAHTSAGGLAVVLEGPAEAPLIRLWRASGRETVLGAHEIPAAWDGAARHNIQNALFATGIALGMGAELDPIRRALRGFKASLADSPGRINRYDGLPFDVIIDKSGTTPGYRTLCEFVDRLPIKGKRILAFHGVGDRRDQDLCDIARRVARSFDWFIAYEGGYLRGRQPGEVPELFREVLVGQGVRPSRVLVCTEKKEAVVRALSIAEAADLVVIGTAMGFGEVFRWLDDYASASAQHLSEVHYLE